MTNNIKILWADDEIDLLKPHLLFLESKGYEVITVNNGGDAIEKAASEKPDVVFMDENMPGISGLDALNKIKQANPSLPIVMITKSEEEHIMEEAIGSKIADYLIKPVNPHQILLSLKRIIDEKSLVSRKTQQGYQQDFMQIGLAVNEKMNIQQWTALYNKIVFWDLELNSTEETGMREILESQKADANNYFCKYISDNYLGMLSTTGEDGPVMSHNMLRRNVFPYLDKELPVFFILMDNLRLDQWKIISEIIREKFKIEVEDCYLSILPTTTQYCRNSIFSGLLPSDIEKRFPDKWSNDEDEGGKNLYEKDFLEDLLKRLRKDVKYSYTKITHLDGGKDLVDKIPNMFSNRFNAIVYNFVDTLSHARTDVSVVRELADDEAAYRSLTASWFKHSPLWEAMQRIAERPARVIITTDHGSIKVKEPIKIVGDKNVNTNLRYKQGKSISYNPKEVFEIRKPELAFLPKLHMSSSFVFARNNDFFAYPNNYNYYVNYYRNTFQHGGISLEEMLIPFVSMVTK